MKRPYTVQRVRRATVDSRRAHLARSMSRGSEERAHQLARLPLFEVAFAGIEAVQPKGQRA
ncbi:MAG: hypothetical protein K0S48_49 [Ramlibacter sp.]|jgi:hypothetical protein|nr:hypothetical protein [Ramlibacter sp.]